MTRGRRRPITKLLFKLAISCVLLGLLLWRVPLGAIGSHLREFDPVTLVLVVGISLACCGLAAMRLWCLLPEYRYRELLHTTFIARFYSIVLPGQIAGDVIKAYRLGRHSARIGHAESATAVDRVVGVFALFLISAIASICTPRLPWPLRAFFVVGAITIVIGSMAAGSRLFYTIFIGRVFSRPQGRIGAFVRDFSAALRDHLHRPKRMLLAMLPALVFHMGAVVMQVLLGDNLGITLDWADWAVVYAGVSLVTLLPISVAGLGLREGGYVGLLGLFGFKPSLALSLSFTIFGISLIAALVGGGWELITMVHRDQRVVRTKDRRAR